MDSNIVLHRLTNNFGYVNVAFDDTELNLRLRERNLEVWKNDKRCIVTKEYSSEAYLKSWFIDQIIISFVYDSIPARFRNNLYFLLILKMERQDSVNIASLINEIEKDYKVCRKYVIETLDDLKRVPSLNDNFGLGTIDPLDFDKEFKTNLYKITDNKDEEKLSLRVKKIVDVYFQFYDEQSENVGEEKIKFINQILTNEVSKFEN